MRNSTTTTHFLTIELNELVVKMYDVIDVLLIIFIYLNLMHILYTGGLSAMGILYQSIYLM